MGGVHKMKNNKTQLKTGFSILVAVISLSMALSLCGCSKNKQDANSMGTGDDSGQVQNAVDTGDHLDAFVKIKTVTDSDEDTQSPDGISENADKTLAQKLADAQNNSTVTRIDTGEEVVVPGYVAKPVDIEAANNDEESPLIRYQIDPERIDTIDTSVLPEGVANYILSAMMYDYKNVTAALVDICLANEIDVSSLKIDEHPSSYTDDYAWDITIINYNAGSIYLYTRYELDETEEENTVSEVSTDGADGTAVQTEATEVVEAVENTTYSEELDRPVISIKYQVIKK